MKLNTRRFVYMRPAGEGNDGGGGSEDRGDDFVGTDDDDAPKKDEPKSEVKEEKTVKAEGKEGEEAKEEGKEGEEKEDGKGKDKPDARLPLARHKEILKKERDAREQAEKKLARYEGGDRIAVVNEEITTAENQVIELDKEYAKLITDGKHEEAAKKMAEIRRMEREIGEKKTDLSSAAASARAVEKVRYDTAVERLEAAYPSLDKDHDDFDEEVSQDVVDLATTYRAKGMTPAESIQKAALKLLGAETKKQDAATTVKPKVDADEVEAEKKRQEAEEKRKKAQVEKNIDTTKKQPADTSKLGADSDKAGGAIVDSKSVLKMSQEDFNKLDDESLSKLRGDVLA